MPYGQDSIFALPERFAYLRDVIRKYTLEDTEQLEEWWKRVSALRPGELKEIADAYLRMEKQGDSEPLSQWIEAQTPWMHRRFVAWIAADSEAGKLGKPRPPRPEHWPRPRELFSLYDRLASNGVAPFTTKAVRFIQHLDWSKLPARLSYLAVPAEKWGKYQFYEQIDGLAESITPEQLQELREFAHRLRSSGDEALAYDWQSSHSYVEHPESNLIHSMLGLLKEFVPPDGTPGLAARRKQRHFLSDLDDDFGEPTDSIESD